MAAEGGPGEPREFQGQRGQDRGLAFGISPACGCVRLITVVVRGWGLKA